MSFYNMLFGQNVNSDIILALIGLKKTDIERFRDCSLDNENKEITILTRTGGGNRDSYPNELLVTNENYKYDEDDEYDRTYATYHFSYPKDLEEDIDKFCNMQQEGIPASIINRILSVFNREPTENDKYEAAYNKQLKIVEQLQKSGDLSEMFNGHTLVPLSDRGMEGILRISEENEGNFLVGFGCLPYKIKILQNESKWRSLDKDKSELEQDKVRMKADIIWEIDKDIWKRYKAKFGDKYPKAVKNLGAKISNKLN